MVAGVDGAAGGEGEAQEGAEDFAGTVGAELSAGGGYALAEDYKSALAAEGAAHRGFFGGEQLFVEPAHRVERLSRAKEKTAARQPEPAIERQRDGAETPSIHRNPAVEIEAHPPPIAPPRTSL